MSGSKIALMLVAVVAIGIFALPSTMSVFGGTHTWYDIASGNTVPCAKCHADKYEELSMSDFHTTFAGGDSSDDCYMCHRADKDIRYAKGGGTPGVDTHAATTIACMACHEYEAEIMKGPFAGGFAQPSGSQFAYTGKVSIDSGTPQKISVISKGDHAVHNAYVQSAVDSNMMEDSNEACIACHTAVPMEIDWTRGYAMRSQSVADSLGDWTVQQLGASGTYAVTTYSDGYGEDTSTTEPYIDQDAGSSVPSRGGRADWLDFSSDRP